MSEKDIGTSEWYDFVGELAETLPGIHLGGQEATLELLEWCDLDAESQVLDVGCGAGVTACLIAERHGSRVVGIDLSEVMISKARAKASKLGWTDGLDFQVVDVYQMPFEGGRFDVALAEFVFTPLPGDKLQSLSEMVRVIRPGGRVAINESTLDVATPYEILPPVEEHPVMHGHFTSDRLRKLFEDSGLQVIRMQETKRVEAPSPAKAMGLGGLLSFMVRVYPKVLYKLLRDARFRKASRIDDQVTKRGKPYSGYTLIVGQTW